MKIIVTESQLKLLSEQMDLSAENYFGYFLGSENVGKFTITSKDLPSFFKEVKEKTRNQKIDLKSVKVSISDKGNSSITFETTTTAKPVVIYVAYSEESDMGKCPSCEKLKTKFPKGKVVTSGTFGNNRKYIVFAVPLKKTGVKNYSARAVNILASQKTEDFRSQIYDDKCPNSDIPSVNNPNGSCGGALTIGFGTLISSHPELKKYLKGSKNFLTKQQGMKYLKEHLDNKVVPTIKRQVSTPLNQNQFDALAVLIYNIGSMGENLTNAINTQDDDEIKKYWSQYIHSKGQVMGGLVKRRKEEIKLFNKP